MKRPANFVKARLYDALRRRGVMPMRALSIDREARINGRDWPSIAYIMIGMKPLENLQQCATEILRNNIPGDFIPAGTWRGGAAIFLRAIRKTYKIEDRCLYVADCFAGLPASDAERFPAEQGFDHSDPFLAVSLDQGKLNFSRFGLLDEQAHFVKGCSRIRFRSCRNGSGLSFDWMKMCMNPRWTLFVTSIRTSLQAGISSLTIT